MLPISNLLKKTCNQIVNHIFLTAYLSLVWSMFVLLPVVFLPVPTACIVMALTLIPATAAVFSVISRAMEGKKYKFGDFLRQFGRLYGRTLILSFVFAIAIIIPVSQWWYYLEVNGSYLIFIFSVFQSYLCLTFLSSQVYTIPLLVVENMKLGAAMNKSIKYFLRKTWYSIGLFVQIVSVTALLAISIVGFFLLFIGMLAFFVMNSTNNVLYGINVQTNREETADYGERSNA